METLSEISTLKVCFATLCILKLKNVHFLYIFLPFFVFLGPSTALSYLSRDRSDKKWTCLVRDFFFGSK